MNVSQQTISRIENGENVLPSDILIHLSKYFHVSTDYILKLSDVRMTQEYRLEMEQMLLRHFEFFLSYCRLNRTNQKVISFRAAQMEKAEEKKIKDMSLRVLSRQVKVFKSQSHVGRNGNQ